jgi:hypothetical protein
MSDIYSEVNKLFSYAAVFAWKKTALGQLTLLVSGKKECLPGVVITIEVSEEASPHGPIVGFRVFAGTKKSGLFQNLEEAKAFALNLYGFWCPITPES